MQYGINDIYLWLKDFYVTLNVKKTKFMILFNTNQRFGAFTNIHLTKNDEEIEIIK